MINKFLLYFYIVVIVLVVFLSYNYYSNKKNTVNKKIILLYNDDIFKEYKKTFDLNQSFAYIWGLSEAKKKIINEDINKSIDINTSIVIKKNKSSLCVNKDCFRFLGLYNKKNDLFVSLYNKNFKSKIKNFIKDENIAYTLYVKNIYKNTVIVADTNSSDEWNFKLFDVNATKYKPKDINESDL